MSARVTGIVLAGGRSRRFGSDKLAATLDGVPLLDRAVAALAATCDEVLVVVPPGGRPAIPAPAVVVTDPEPFGGPLVGLLAGLERASAPIALVVGGDMPWLDTGVLRLLADRLREGRATALQLEVVGTPGAAERLPLAVRTEHALAVAGTLAARGERRLGAVPTSLRAAVLPAVDWTALDPAARTPRDVDLPDDLAAGS